MTTQTMAYHVDLFDWIGFDEVFQGIGNNFTYYISIDRTPRVQSVNEATFKSKYKSPLKTLYWCKSEKKNRF